MKNDIILKLENLKKKIEIMPDNYQKSLMVKNYLSLFNYLSDAKLIDSSDIKKYTLDTDLTKFIKAMNKNLVNYINDLLMNNEKLLQTDLKLYFLYAEGNWNKFKKPVFIKDSIGYSLVDKFFKTLGDDIYEMYLNVKNNNLSYLEQCLDQDGSMVINGACYEFSGDGYSYVNVKKPNNNMASFVALVHEVGHVYQFHLLRNYSNFCDYSLVAEMMSTMFEKMFIKFLENDYNYSSMAKDLWYQYHVNHFWMLIDILLTSALYKKNLISSIDRTLECDTSCSDDEIVQIAQSIGYEIQEYPKLNFHDYSYIIGNLISDYFLEKMEEDFKKGFKASEDFIQEAHYYSVAELLDRFTTDISYTKENIRKVIQEERSYQKKK